VSGPVGALLPQEKIVSHRAELIERFLDLEGFAFSDNMSDDEREQMDIASTAFSSGEKRTINRILLVVITAVHHPSLVY
jgi:hypothetical protein